MNALGKTLLESGAVLAAGLAIVGLMMYAFSQNAAAFGG
jgi:hypothetical protein